MISFIKEYVWRSVKFMCILAAPEGVKRIRADRPDVDIYVAAIDEKRNDHGYIAPIWAALETGSSEPYKFV